MKKPILALLILQIILTMILLPQFANAASDGIENMAKAKPLISNALNSAKDDMTKSKQIYDQYHDLWMDVEDSVKIDSKAAYKEIEAEMGQVDYAFTINKQEEVITALQKLQQVLDHYIQGQYSLVADVQEDKITLSGFVTLLEQTKEQILKHDQTASMNSISKVRDSWLSVEGNVVAQSASVYSNSERDMVIANAMITNQDYDGAANTLDTMIAYLTPLAQKTSYTYWDAAMIPIREGLEALLVVGALLAFVKKSNNRKGGFWIWAGVLVGLLVSAVLAVIVKFAFSSGAFGTNNYLIGGWTGVFAAIMLLYMSYWLHSNSNIQKWNAYIQIKTQTALTTGRILSLGILSFLAVFREGTETVLFIIGMVNQISVQQLLLGIFVGFGILAIVAVLMLYVGMKLPIRPFFLVSSIIVFYLCIKFTGLGVRSLQLAGTIPTSNSSMLPSINFLGFFPSWESALPQIIIALGAISFLIGSKIKKRLSKQSTVLS